MGISRLRFGQLAALMLCLVSIDQLHTPAADLLRWDARANRADADFDGADLQKVLKRVSAQTGWKIYIEPNLRRAVSVRFKNATSGEALKMLLGELNFALLPQRGAASKLLVYQSTVQEATQFLDPEGQKGKPIANELVVTLKSGGRETIDELAKKLGAKVIGGIDGKKTYRLKFEDAESAEAARATLASNESVAAVDSNYAMEKPTQVDPLQFSSTQPFSLKPSVSTDTSKVVVGLIDTAIQPLTGSMKDFVLPTLHPVSSETAVSSELTHGTSMAETILRGLASVTREGETSPVRILPVDVYGGSPETSTFDVAQGIYAAINGGATIINLSLGGDGDSKFLAKLVQESHDQGVLFFGAAGNQPTTQPTYPAAYPEVVAVTAGDRKGNIAPYANRGDFVDVIAPGMSVVQFEGQPYMVSGTSTSTAFVSGAASALRSTGQTSAQAEASIRSQLALKPAKGN